MDPSWQPDPDLYTSDEVNTFFEARQSCEPLTAAAADEGGGIPKWAWLAGGGAVGGLLILLLSGGDDGGGDTTNGGNGGGTGDLPDFPDPPGAP